MALHAWMFLFEELELFEVFLNITLWVGYCSQTCWEVFGLLNPQFEVNAIMFQAVGQSPQLRLILYLHTVGEMGGGIYWITRT